MAIEIVRAALQRGDAVVAAAREPEAVERVLGRRDQLLAVPLDVTEERQAQAAVGAALMRFGQIDVLVNNAGRGLLGAVEEASAEEVRAVFAVNVEGLLNVTRAVLPSMRARRTGRILNMSCVGGFRACKAGACIAAPSSQSKGSAKRCAPNFRRLASTSQSLSLEPSALTSWTPDRWARARQIISDYGETAGEVRQWADNTNHGQLGDPVKGAEAIVAIATSAEPPLRLQLGTDCVTQVEAKLANVKKELAAWRSLSESTDYKENSETSAA